MGSGLKQANSISIQEPWLLKGLVEQTISTGPLENTSSIVEPVEVAGSAIFL